MLIKPHLMKFAEEEALQSPCLRRKYGVIISQGKKVLSAHNTRVGKCCDGNLCVRDRFRVTHGESVERGAEIHAEQAALLSWKEKVLPSTHVYLAGYDKKGNLLKGKDCRPCHLCAMMLKFSGFEYVVIRQSDDSLEPVSLSRILEEHEEGWGEPYVI